MIPIVLAKLNGFYFAACTIKSSPFFGFPHWWKYIKDTEKDALGNCVPKFNFPGDIWAVGLAVIDMLLYLGGVVAVISIIYSGLMYVTSGGNSEKASSAMHRIINSFIGLAIVVFAAALVAFIGNRLR